MTDEELIARLRSAPADGMGTENLCLAAADRIEALVKRLEIAVDVVAESGRLRGQAEARAERLDAALIWCSGSADFNEGGVARKGWLKVCAPLLTGGKDE